MVIEDLSEQVDYLHDHVEDWRCMIVELQEDEAASEVEGRLDWLQEMGMLPEEEPELDDDDHEEEGAGVGLESARTMQAGEAVAGTVAGVMQAEVMQAGVART